MRFDPKDIVEHLRHNLERYPYGDGFTVFRELLQNADDARASTVSLHLLDGWTKAANPLLQGPGLLLVNDGEFDARSALGMQTFGGSVKASDQEAVGRFGLGQKSVFHLCDAFVVVPHGNGHEHFVVNPFETLAQQGDDCIIWKTISDEEAALIVEAAAQMVTSPFCLSLWFPLRRPGLRPKPKSRGIVASDIVPESLNPLTERWRLGEMLASLRHVRRISVQIAGSRAEVDRGEATRMTGYELTAGEHAFGGPLGGGLASVGRERMAPDGFRGDLRQSESWPRSRNRLTDEEEPQKAAPHGAAILLFDPQAQADLSADWSVLLPVVEAMATRPLSGKGRLKLLLHGCYFVDSGRKSVLGLQGEAGETSDEARVRARWNKAIRDDVVLPLVPAVLYDALSTGVFSREALAAAVAALSGSDFGRMHRKAIASKHVLAQVVEVATSGAIARWRLVPSTAELRPLPAPDERGRVAFAELLPDLAARGDRYGLTLVCGVECLLAADAPCWRPRSPTHYAASRYGLRQV